MRLYREGKKVNMTRINKQFKIAMIGHKRFPSREGGVEVVVQELATRLVEAGYQVTVYNRSGHHVSGKKFDTNHKKRKWIYKGVNVDTVFTIHGKGLAAFTSSFFATIKAIFGKYDFIHYHAEGACVMIWIPHLFGIKTIATIHGLDWQRRKWNRFARWYLKLGEKIAVKYADEVIVLTKSNQNYFKKEYGRNTVIIHNGIEKPAYRKVDLIKQKWDLEKDSYIVFVSRIVPEKGIENLIEAFKQVNTDKKLVIAGGASDTNEFFIKIKQMAADDERIIFTNFIQGRDLEELYSNSYVYVLPSEIEGMPMSLLEAMSYGNCCLVSDIRENEEIVEDHALMFQKGDVNDLREKLQLLCDDSKIVHKYKGKSSEFICNKYGWDDAVKAIINVYLKNAESST